jgi:hypothetical protein
MHPLGLLYDQSDQRIESLRKQCAVGDPFKPSALASKQCIMSPTVDCPYSHARTPFPGAMPVTREQ